MSGTRAPRGRMSRALRWQALIPLICLAGSMNQPPTSSPHAVAQDAPEPTAALPPRRLFISGHSLTGRPFPDHLAALALAAGRPLAWNMQHLFGSSLRARTMGLQAGAWSGYREGLDRDGEPVDVLRELAPGAGQPPYDTLILTEQHTLLESLMWNDTIGHTLDYQARFSAANPDGRTYMFASWLHIDDIGDPRRWIAYERAAAGAWRCTVAQINATIAARDGQGRVTLIPAAEGLAALVEQAMGPQGVAGITGATRRDTMAALFTDDVHLTETGTYYIALLTHLVLHGDLPPTVWRPDIPPATAAALQDFAVGFLGRATAGQPPTTTGCADDLSAHYVPVYLAYLRDTRWRDEGWLRAQVKWARFSVVWPRLLRSVSSDNPFRVR